MIDRQRLSDIYAQFSRRHDENLCPGATSASQAHRQFDEDPGRLRTPFALDRDRIVYSGAYRRYQGKTQVFAFANLFDEEMTNRSLHTTYVSQIARTIGRILGLNLELLEAIALGHDLGHTPFGHDGERALSTLCEEQGIGKFMHNIESLHIVDHISRGGKGMNLTFQVRDGIISHDGEVHNTRLKPWRAKTEEDIAHYVRTQKQGRPWPANTVGYTTQNPWMPATLEGCVVRISDTIAYIGQDIEDAIRYNIISREDLPADCVAYLGSRNNQIVDTLVKSVISNSYEQDYVGFDEETSDYLLKLKRFNYAKIYTNQAVKNSNEIIARSMRILYHKYLADIHNQNLDSRIFVHFLNHKTTEYRQTFNPAEQVRDFIATMTDRYFYEEVKHYMLPGRIDMQLLLKKQQ